jgi:copper chaperone
MSRTIIEVRGMTCMGCVASVTRVLKAVDGVLAADVSLEKGHATVDYDPSRTAPDALKRAVEAVGYEAA